MICDNYNKNIKIHYENEIHNFHYEMKKVSSSNTFVTWLCKLFTVALLSVNNLNRYLLRYERNLQCFQRSSKHVKLCRYFFVVTFY